MTDLRLTPIAASLPSTVPFVGPEAQERARNAAFDARLGANESVFGPSPSVAEAMAQTDIWKYGDPENHALRRALAVHHRISPDNVMVGEGIDGLLGYIARLFVGPGDHVVTSLGAYPTFNYHVSGYGGTLHTVPYNDDQEDPAALFAKAAETQAKLVYLANPDNPMGTWHDGETLTKALDDLPLGTLLVLDEAYIDCAPAGTAPNIDADDPRVIRMRTFSKAYGMAGARVGYAIGAGPLIDAFNKVRNHFGMNRAAQAGALAALKDQAYLAQVVDHIAVARTQINEIAHSNGLKPLPSATNFVTIDCGRDGTFAKAVLDGLIARGIFVRMPFAAPQNRCIRVSCGTHADLDAFAAAFPLALADANGG
ncbi:pyridoxal phosphate-dependent aminotransferase [Tateyamaria sp. syn59]|uniref:pyridoxal phosphate-dependent aminotransferase n=1 Tax=Tateyamaria sp. syn59 TaxID=2576942 RepID=UPI0011BE41EC|nr:pyridoxal phosphate-dependent aminotransferase [Tateyamaria sp. syn59]